MWWKGSSCDSMSSLLPDLMFSKFFVKTYQDIIEYGHPLLDFYIEPPVFSLHDCINYLTVLFIFVHEEQWLSCKLLPNCSSHKCEFEVTFIILGQFFVTCLNLRWANGIGFTGNPYSLVWAKKKKKSTGLSH